jgi:hypothetical protein
MGAESKRLFLLAGVASVPVGATQPVEKIQPGIYTNEEEVYFDTLAKRPAAKWTSITVESYAEGELVTFVDAFGKPFMFAPAPSTYTARPKSAERLEIAFQNGRTTELRRARRVSCWVAIRKDKPKADGTEDWYFARDVRLHDQGGRAMVGGDDSGAPQVMIRVRNVTWDKGSTNAPVVALYIHKPDNWDKAESYSWAAPDSARVGINLRWVQAGCTIEGIGAPSSLNSDNFKSNEEAKAQ